MFEQTHTADELPSSTRSNATTKAELLSRAKVAIEDGERSLRDAAEALALAHKDFDATQREIAAAVGKSAAWVNRLRRRLARPTPTTQRPARRRPTLPRRQVRWRSSNLPSMICSQR
jgi:hypothetical protein